MSIIFGGFPILSVEAYNIKVGLPAFFSCLVFVDKITLKEYTIKNI